MRTTAEQGAGHNARRRCLVISIIYSWRVSALAFSIIRESGSEHCPRNQNPASTLETEISNPANSPPAPQPQPYAYRLRSAIFCRLARSFRKGSGVRIQGSRPEPKPTAREIPARHGISQPLHPRARAGIAATEKTPPVQSAHKIGSRKSVCISPCQTHRVKRSDPIRSMTRPYPIEKSPDP
jgi:hypothetical protein